MLKGDFGVSTTVASKTEKWDAIPVSSSPKGQFSSTYFMGPDGYRSNFESSMNTIRMKKHAEKVSHAHGPLEDSTLARISLQDYEEL